MKNLILFFLPVVIITTACNNDSTPDPANDPALKDVEAASVKEFKELVFVGSYQNKPSIYSYNKEENISKVLWHDKNESVLDLEVSDDLSVAFFITYRRIDRRNTPPEYILVKLFRIDLVTGKADLIKKLGDVIQIYSYWDNIGRFVVISNSIDITIASYVNKNKQVFNSFGKLLLDENEVFDISKDGYPLPDVPDLKLTSPKERFMVFEKADSIFIRNNYNNEEMFVSSDYERIINIQWAENLKQVVFLVLSKSDDSENPNTKLFIFDVIEKKAVKTFNEIGKKRFLLYGDFLFYESGLNKSAFVKIFKLSELKEAGVINIKGGCALRSLTN